MVVINYAAKEQDGNENRQQIADESLVMRTNIVPDSFPVYFLLLSLNQRKKTRKEAVNGCVNFLDLCTFFGRGAWKGREKL